ncbi:MAG TPA: hypothetical protein VJ124_00130 [Pyrinomonadaceae bacterium]|nr:hypothetical protein [Pyrinomonadaceae bacterium]
MFNAVKKIFLWNYARNSWQWDILCVIILIFIFLTPKDWFQNSERGRGAAHQIPVSTLLIGPEMIDIKGDKSLLEQHLRTITKRPEVEVLAVRKLLDEEGKVRGYEIDIR